MIKFDLVPYVRVGPIEFGESQKSVIEKIGTPDKIFHRVKGRAELTLSFRDKSAFVVLNKEHGFVEAVEFYEGANFFVEGVQILNLKNKDAISYLNRIDISIEKVGVDTLISRRL